VSSKIFKTLFFIFSLFTIYTSFASSWDSIKIITREQWWANESYRYLDSKEWIDLLNKWKNTPKRELTESQKIKAQLEAEKVKKANNFLVKNYSDIIWVKSVEKYENWHKLAWPLARVKKRTAIVIHHTDTDYWTFEDSYDAIRRIYKYHAISRWWWDIGYNYLIGFNWEIFEWRAGGDDVVGAHDKWNNQAAIWISVIWNYNNKDINQKQYESLKKLINYLVKKYNIDLSQKVDYFKWCVGTSQECLDKPLIISHDYPIIWHRDAGHTACPWEKLYATLQKMKKELNVWVSTKDQILLRKIKKLLLKASDEELITFLSKIEVYLDKHPSSKKKTLLLEVKKQILDIEKNRSQAYFWEKPAVSFDDNHKIKVKLSYPFNDYINFQVSWKYKARLVKQKTQTLISFYQKDDLDTRIINLNFKFNWNDIYLSWKKIASFENNKFFRISIPKWKVIKIKSWDRKPSWDKSGKLNDNEFKGDIIFYKKNWKLIVVNELYLTDYLKWLWEVSNSTNPEKIKTIIVLARTYARWYMTKARKFAWEWFDASDDPNVFQKYLGFGLEKRSPNVNKIVEETKDLVVTYNWDLIKPWYFSSSNWKTISFNEYCKNAQGVPDCAHPEKFPFLLWVKDSWGIWKTQAGHWVWVPGTGVEYMSKQWFDFATIIRYFLKWVKIKYL